MSVDLQPGTVTIPPGPPLVVEEATRYGDEGRPVAYSQTSTFWTPAGPDSSFERYLISTATATPMSSPRPR